MATLLFILALMDEDVPAQCPYHINLLKNVHVALVRAPKYKGFGTGGEDNVDDNKNYHHIHHHHHNRQPSHHIIIIVVFIIIVIITLKEVARSVAVTEIR